MQVKSKGQGEHSEILSTFIKLSFVIKIFVLSIFEWLLKTGFTVFLTLKYSLVSTVPALMFPAAASFSIKLFFSSDDI